jgi:hypothetical protein
LFYGFETVVRWGCGGGEGVAIGDDIVGKLKK